MAPTDSSAPSFIERVQDFVADNRRAILIGTAIAVGGAAAVYYASTSQRSTDTDPERRPKDKKKGVKPSKKRKPAKDRDAAPILEEVPPKSPKPDDEGAAPVRFGTLGDEI